MNGRLKRKLDHLFILHNSVSEASLLLKFQHICSLIGHLPLYIGNGGGATVLICVGGCIQDEQEDRKVWKANDVMWNTTLDGMTSLKLHIPISNNYLASGNDKNRLLPL